MNPNITKDTKQTNRKERQGPKLGRPKQKPPSHNQAQRRMPPQQRHHHAQKSHQLA